MFERTPKIRWFQDWCFWLAVVGSLAVNGIGLACFVVICERQHTTETLPILLLGYGDSNYQGFPIDVVSLDPGAYRQGPQNTPGGDNAPLPPPGEALLPPSDSPPTPPEPKKEPEPAPKPTVEEPLPKKEPLVEEAPPPMPLPPPKTTPAATEKPTGVVAANDSKPSTSDKGASTPLPGAPGGANMRIGTPSAGGTVGTRTGVRLPSAPLPPYPAEARQRGWEGKPVVLVAISADGYVTSATIHQSCGYAVLDNAAIEYVKTLRYIPARLNNVAIATTIHHEVDFHFR